MGAGRDLYRSSPTSFQRSVGTGQGEMAINRSIGSFAPICKGTSSWQEWQSTAAGCPGRLWSLLLWRYSRPVWMPTCAACCRGPALQGSWAQWSLEVPSNPYNSVILWYLSPLVIKQSWEWCLGPGSFQWCPATEQGATGTNWNTGSSIWTQGNPYFEGDRALEQLVREWRVTGNTTSQE